jgi:putative transposase
MIKIYRYRAYPAKEQQQEFQKIFGAARYIYNWALALRKADYDRQKEAGEKKIKTLSIYDISKQMTLLKQQEETKWLNEVPAVCLIWALNHLDTAYKNFFRRVKQGGAGFPKFKNRNSRKTFSYHQGYVISQEQQYVTVPKNGKLKLVVHRRFEGEPKTVTIIQEPSGKYYCSIVVKSYKDIPASPVSTDISRYVGMDVGVVNAVSLSDGYRLVFKRNWIKDTKRILKRSRSLSRKVKGSSNFRKAKTKLAIAHEVIALKRKSDIEKISCRLVEYLKKNKLYGVCLRKYDIKSMLDTDDVEKDENGKAKHGRRMIKKRLNKVIADGAMGMLCEQIKYKLKQAGINVLEFAASETLTTQRCCRCKSEDVNINLLKRVLTCKNCNHSEDMDFNAAKNTLWFALQEINNEKIKVC